MFFIKLYLLRPNFMITDFFIKPGPLHPGSQIPLGRALTNPLHELGPGPLLIGPHPRLDPLGTPLLVDFAHPLLLLPEVLLMLLPELLNLGLRIPTLLPEPSLNLADPPPPLLVVSPTRFDLFLDVLFSL